MHGYQTSQSSDIDMVVYCMDAEKKYQIANFCKAFWGKIGLESDVMIYFFSEGGSIFRWYYTIKKRGKNYNNQKGSIEV